MLALLVCWYGWATLPHLGDFPLVSWDEGMIAAPAYKLAAQGIYGNDLYAGYYQSDMYNYEYMPAYPLLLALTFKLFGVGVLQARLSAVVCGLGALLLTFVLGRQMYGTPIGLLAATLLVGVRLRVAPDVSGVVLLDVARVARYEPLTLCLALATCCCLLWSESKLATNQALEQQLSITAKDAKDAGFIKKLSELGIPAHAGGLRSASPRSLAAGRAAVGLKPSATGTKAAYAAWVKLFFYEP